MGAHTRVFSFTLDSSSPSECDGQESSSTVVDNAEKYQEYIITINSDNTGTGSVICEEEQSVSDCLNQPVYDDDCECRNSSGNFEWSVSENIITTWEPNDPGDTESRNFSITGNVLTIKNSSQQNCGIELTETTYIKQ